MPGTATPIYPQTLRNWVAQLLSTTGAYALPTGLSSVTTGLVALVIGDTNGDKVEAITVTSTDTSAQTLILVLFNGTNMFILGEVTIPIGAGTTATGAVDVLRSASLPGLAYDANGNKYLYVASGFTLYVGTIAAVTALKTIDVVAYGGQF